MYGYEDDGRAHDRILAERHGPPRKGESREAWIERIAVEREEPMRPYKPNETHLVRSANAVPAREVNDG